MKKNKIIFYQYIEKEKYIDSSQLVFDDIRDFKNQSLDIDFGKNIYGNSSFEDASVPIKDFSDYRGVYNINLCLGIKHKDDVFSYLSNLYRGSKELLNSISEANENKIESKVAKKIAIKNLELRNFPVENITLNSLKNYICEKFGYNSDEKISKGWVLNGIDYFSPYISIYINEEIQGYSKEDHGDIFKEENELSFKLKSKGDRVGSVFRKNSLSLFYPSLDKDGFWAGKVKGFYFMRFPVISNVKHKTTKEGKSVFFNEMIVDDYLIDFFKYGVEIVMISDEHVL